MPTVRTTLAAVALLLAALPSGAQNAVVEDMTIDVSCSSPRQAECRQRLVVTINNDQQADMANFFCSLNNSDQLTAFSGQVADADGRVIRKFKKSDLQRSEYSSMLAVDAYMLALSYTPPSYPVTVTYEWTEQMANDLIELPRFVPQPDYGVSVRHAAYTLTTPADFACRHALQNMASDCVSHYTAGNRLVTKVELHDLPPLVQEPYSRPLRERMAMAHFAPERFWFYKTEGSLASWQDYGRWSWALLEGRQHLPDNIRQEVHRLTDGCNTPRQKVERLYDFLGRTTRYVSIQLGIGGHQPMPAADVARTGYGDCKALANYMRALLLEAGVASVYTEISTRNRRLLPHFASVGQLNHVVLMVPLADAVPADTLWLECTNPQLPLGYVHEDIAGHDALLITPDGGQLCRLPSYADGQNRQLTRVDVTLQADGSATLDVSQSSCLRQYESMLPLVYMKADDRARTLQRMLRLQQSVVERLDVSQQPQAVVTLSARLTSRRYASQTGQRLFVPLCPLHQGYKAPRTDSLRTEPVVLDYGYEDCDTIAIRLPDGFAVESLPQAVSVQQPFGQFASEVSQSEGCLLVVNRLLMRAGSYAPEQFPAFADFMKQVAAAYGQRVVLRRNN